MWKSKRKIKRSQWTGLNGNLCAFHIRLCSSFPWMLSCVLRVCFGINFCYIISCCIPPPPHRSSSSGGGFRNVCECEWGDPLRGAKKLPDRKSICIETKKEKSKTKKHTQRARYRRMNRARTKRIGYAARCNKDTQMKNDNHLRCTCLQCCWKNQSTRHKATNRRMYTGEGSAVWKCHSFVGVAYKWIKREKKNLSLFGAKNNGGAKQFENDDGDGDIDICVWMFCVRTQAALATHTSEDVR